MKKFKRYMGTIMSVNSKRIEFELVSSLDIDKVRKMVEFGIMVDGVTKETLRKNGSTLVISECDSHTWYY